MGGDRLEALGSDAGDFPFPGPRDVLTLPEGASPMGLGRVDENGEAETTE